MFHGPLNFDLLGFFGVILSALNAYLEVEGLVRVYPHVDRFDRYIEDSLVFADTFECFEHDVCLSIIIIPIFL